MYETKMYLDLIILFTFQLVCLVFLFEIPDYPSD